MTRGFPRLPKDVEHSLSRCSGTLAAKSHGAVVAIGNAPTALFHLLNMLEDRSCPRPAAIIGCPVGFVGAARSKAALMQDLPAPS